MLPILGTLSDLESGRTNLSAVYDRVAETLAAREPTVQAFVRHHVEAARAAAEGAGGGPLGGLPHGVKDIIDTADFPTEYGSAIYEGWRPRADAAVVTMTRRAGGVLLGKTRTTEFANLQPTVTTNPLDAGRTPGGSSSGSAAAVAAGMVALAFGTQTAGSVIRPAAFCGVAAIKPSFRLLPAVGVKTFSWHLDTVGLFAAGVADCAYALAALTGRELRVDVRNFGAPRLGFLAGHPWETADADMLDALAGLARRARAQGAGVRDIVLPSLYDEAFEAQKIIMDYEGALALAWEYDTAADRISPQLREGLERGRALSVTAYDAARSIANTARRKLVDVFEDVDVLVAPSAPGVAPEGLSATGDPRFNRLWTLMGVPAVNVPGLAGTAGMPLGVQVIAPFGKDRVALAAADWLERLVAHG